VGLCVSISLLIIKPLFENQIRHDYCCRSWNSLYAMNKDPSSFISALLNKINRIIKDAFYIFDGMVLQMVPFVFECVFVIVLANVSAAIYDMSDLIVKKCLFVLGYCLWPQVYEVLNDFRANKSELTISCFNNTCVRLLILIWIFFWCSLICIFCVFHFLHFLQKYVHFEFRSFIFFLFLWNILKHNWRHC